MTTSNRGGARQGAGRKPGQRAARPKVPRLVSLRPELWAAFDAAQEAQGLTRTAFFEVVVQDWLDRNTNVGQQ